MKPRAEGKDIAIIAQSITLKGALNLKIYANSYESKNTF